MPVNLKGGVACLGILRQTSVKMAVLLHKQATMPFHSIIAVRTYSYVSIKRTVLLNVLLVESSKDLY